jgi:cell division protein FtsB
MHATPGATPSFRSSADTHVRKLALLLLVLAVLLAWLQYRLWFGKGGQREVEALQDQVTQQAYANSGLKQRNDVLAAEVKDLKSGEAAIEERARSELGMIKPGETFYRVVDGAGSTAPQPVEEEEPAQ